MSEQRPLRKQYIGDGVYAVDTGYMIMLTTENGIEVTNTIAIEDHVMIDLIDYAKRMWPSMEGLA